MAVNKMNVESNLDQLSLSDEEWETDDDMAKDQYHHQTSYSGPSERRRSRQQRLLYLQEVLCRVHIQCHDERREMQEERRQLARRQQVFDERVKDFERRVRQYEDGRREAERREEQRRQELEKHGRQLLQLQLQLKELLERQPRPAPQREVRRADSTLSFLF